MKTVYIALMIIVIAGVGYYFISKPATPSLQSGAPSTVPAATPPVTSIAPTPPAATPAHDAITIQNFAFSPASLTVKAGTTVTWTNKDGAGHTVTSDSGSLMSSSLLANGQSYSVTFSTPGTFTYHCSVHPMMHGTVIVTD